jgi:hypothetical protein
MSDTLMKAFAFQARACASLGAGFSAGIVARAGADLATGGPVARLLEPWADRSAEQLIRDAIALRLLASLHHLVLTGTAPALAACYPPGGLDPDRAWTTGREALMTHADQVSLFLQHEPQTNEVRRSACLLGGFLTIARQTGLPLRCFELGASAGLNSLWDAYRYEIGGGLWGDAQSPVVLPCRWQGAAPDLATRVTVLQRHGCDRRPVDLARGGQVKRLLAYCWAEQGERMARLKAAIAMAQARHVAVDAMSAARWIHRAGPRVGAATVVFHSIMWQYMPPDEQEAAWQAIRAHQSLATREAPFFWLRMEYDEGRRKHELRLWSAPDGGDRLLATVHPHGEHAFWH